MTKIFKIPFATQGDRTAVPDDVQADGSLSYTQGYGYDYERDQATDPEAKDIEREKMNSIFHDITGAVGEIQAFGMPVWAEEGKPYAIRSVVYHNKKAWQSKIENNNTEPAAGVAWTELKADVTAEDVGAYTKVEANLKFQSVGNYADKNEVNGKLAKDQNGADIPDKAAFISNLGLGDVIKSPLIAIPGGSDVLTYFPGKPTGFYSSGSDLNNTPEPAAWRNFIWLNHGSDRYGQLICLWGGGKSAVRSLNATEWDSKWSVALSDADIVDALGNSQKKAISQKTVTEELQAKSLLTKIKEVDGAGSGLDADLLRGLPAEFGAYATPEGYQKLPSGIIIQWGRKIIAPETIETIPFPIAFTRQLFVVVGSQHSANYSQSTATISQSSYTKESFGVRNNSTTNQQEFRYISFGQ